MIRMPESLFMLGAGGMGMAPLAIYLRESGARVLGFDDSCRTETKAILESAAIPLVEDGKIPPEIDEVVYSSAISPDHPVYREAQSRGLRLTRRGRKLAEVVSRRRVIAVAGSHGKTTSAGMLICALKAAGVECGYVLGGLFSAPELPPAAMGEASWVVVELDESDGTIDLFSPEMTLLVNLDWDHPDQYAGFEALKVTFSGLVQRTTGNVFIPYDCPVLRDLVKDSSSVGGLSFGSDGDYRARLVTNQDGRRSLELSGAFASSEIEFPMLGSFNGMNAAGALAVVSMVAGDSAGLSLGHFGGIQRRQTRLLDTSRLVVYSDYAHHPTEIHALLDFAIENYPERKRVVIFQPHRHSRTRQYGEAFAKALQSAHVIFLLEVYGAGEPECSGGSSDDLAQHCSAGPPLVRILHEAALRPELCKALHEPAILLFLGAGDIDRMAERFVDAWNGVEFNPANSNQKPRSTGLKNDAWWLDLLPRLQPATSLLSDVPLARKTTLGVGGSARFYTEPRDLEDLCVILEGAANAGVEVCVLGRGSNLLVPDAGFGGLLIRLSGGYWESIRPLGGGRLWAGAGVRLKRLCGEACRAGFSGLEFLEGIPGSLGGALRMNAGAMGSWIFNVVERVELVSPCGRVASLERNQLQPGYRDCRELRSSIAASAVLRAEKDVPVAEIRARIDAFSQRRRQTQPRESSAGCIFKNPEGDSAGRLIEVAGLKGLRKGKAEISPVHGNFIINRGDATFDDVVSLIREVRHIVKRELQVELEPEVRLLGKRWSQLL